MRTRPHALSSLASWEFHDKSGESILYQTGASLFDPVKEIIPYLRRIYDLMDDRDEIPVSVVAATRMKSVPGLGDMECPPIWLGSGEPEINNWLTALYSFKDVCRAFWSELKTPARLFTDRQDDSFRAIDANKKATFRWRVWYFGGSPLELSFQAVDRSGKVEPMFDVERCEIERFVDLMSAADDVASLFSL